MEDVKGLLQSKTFYGALLAAAAAVLSMLGFDLGDHQGMANDIFVLVGAVIAVYGRVVAVKRIGK